MTCQRKLLIFVFTIKVYLINFHLKLIGTQILRNLKKNGAICTLKYLRGVMWEDTKK